MFMYEKECLHCHKLFGVKWRYLLKKTKYKIGFSRKGKLTGIDNPNWIEDRSKIKTYDDRRDDSNYKIWRKEVYTRDNFRCKINNKDCDGRIEAHHILDYDNYVELRYKTNNGITLCHTHHPRGRVKEKRMIPIFQELLLVSKI